MRNIPIPLIALALLGLSGSADATSVEAGQPAPALVADTLDGAHFDLSALKGHVVVLNFWATWCAPCREEMPALDKIYQRYREQGVAMIGLSVDKTRDRDAVRKIMQKFSYPATLVRDAKDDGFDTPNAIPVTYVVDAQGTVRKVFGGDDPIVTDQGLTAVLTPLLAK